MRANLETSLSHPLGLYDISHKLLPTTLMIEINSKKEARASKSSVVELRHLILAIFPQVHGKGGLAVRELFRKVGIRDVSDLRKNLNSAQEFISRGNIKKSILDQNGVEHGNKYGTKISRSNAVDTVYELAEEMAREERKKHIESIHIALGIFSLILNTPPGNAEIDPVRYLFSGTSYEAELATVASTKSRRLVS